MSIVPDLSALTGAELESLAADLDTEASQVRARSTELQTQSRDAIRTHEDASDSFMDGTGSTADDVQRAAAVVNTISSTTARLDARLADLSDTGARIAAEFQHRQALTALADAAEAAYAARRDYLDRFAAALPQAREIAEGILEASDRWRDACEAFRTQGLAAGLPPLDEATVHISSTGADGVVSTRVAPAPEIGPMLARASSLLAERGNVAEPETALNAAREGHRLGRGAYTFDLHHEPAWGSVETTHPPGGDASRLLVRSLIDLALED